VATAASASPPAPPETHLRTRSRREILGNSDLLLSGAYEAQMWHDGGGPNADEGDLGLEGFLVGFGLNR